LDLFGRWQPEWHPENAKPGLTARISVAFFESKVLRLERSMAVKDLSLFWGEDSL